MTYPLNIQNVGEDTYIVMSKGHHDVHEFMRAVRAEGYAWLLGMPQHVWMRAVPTRRDGYRFMYHKARPGSRGAFPCTYAWEDYGPTAYVAPDLPQPVQHPDQRT